MLELFYIPFQSVEASPQARSPFRTIQSGTYYFYAFAELLCLLLRSASLFGEKSAPRLPTLTD